MTIRDVITGLKIHAACHGYETPVEVCLMLPTTDKQNLEETLFEIISTEPRFTPNGKRRIAIFTEPQ